MKAYQLVDWQQPPELRDVEVPEPGPGQVLLKVAGAGACHSDLHVMAAPAGYVPGELPFTLGHENTGWIEQLGEGVTDWELGQPVAVYGPWGCGRCRPCRESKENYCERQAEQTAHALPVRPDPRTRKRAEPPSAHPPQDPIPSACSARPIQPRTPA